MITFLKEGNHNAFNKLINQNVGLTCMH